MDFTDLVSNSFTKTSSSNILFILSTGILISALV
jgi:hypothetical protein